MPKETTVTDVGSPRAQVEGTRGRVLHAIRAASAPITVAGLADDLDLHPNTLRFHLHALREDGLVVQERQPTGGRGRPRVAYRASERGARSGERNYQLLADILVSDLAVRSSRPRAAARAAGRRWGRRLASRHASAPRRDVAAAVLAEMGFAPEPAPTTEAPEQLVLHNCPFRELVDTHQQVVCALHGGMVEALLDTDADAQAALVPFATPTTCAVRLSPGGTDAG